MKKWKFLLMAVLGALFVVSSSCSKDEDGEDMGNTPPDQIPSDKVAFHKYGMTAFFPQEGWKYMTDSSFVNLPANSADFSRLGVVSYLLADSVRLPGAESLSYNTLIYFSRFLKAFDSEQDANDLVEEFRYIREGECDSNGKFPELELDSVGNVDFATVGKYNGSVVETWNKFGYYQANYFVYSDVKDSLYIITLSINTDDFKEKTRKYQDCMEIVNSFRIDE